MTEHDNVRLSGTNDRGDIPPDSIWSRDHGTVKKSDVKAGWMVSMSPGSHAAFVADVKDDTVCVVRRNPAENGWMTHWLSRGTFNSRVTQHLGYTAKCPACKSVPTFYDGVQFECARCGHEFTEPLDI